MFDMFAFVEIGQSVQASETGVYTFYHYGVSEIHGQEVSFSYK